MRFFHERHDERLREPVGRTPQSDRLTLLGLLARRAPEPVPAAEAASALNVAPAAVWAEASRLLRNGLVVWERRDGGVVFGLASRHLGTVLGAAPAPSVHGWRPSVRASGAPEARFDVLFVGVANQARSIFAEAILNEVAGARFHARSAGTRPGAAVHPLALATLERRGHDTAGLRPTPLAAHRAEGAPRMDFVFSVCTAAAAEDCAPRPGQPMTASWAIHDPAAFVGPDARRAAAFEEAYEALRARIEAFAALPLARLHRVATQLGAGGPGRPPGAGGTRPALAS